MLGEEILLEEYPFQLIARIELKTDKYGIPIESHPAKRYENSRSLRLNGHGNKSFCHFALKPCGGLDLSLYHTGVYAIAGTSVKYIGRTQTSLNQRFDGYGSIQPRNCYEGGQSTNCRINNSVLEDAMDGYDGLVKDAHRIVAGGLDGQVDRFKSIGRAGTGNTQWNLPPNFANVLWLIADHEGPQMLRNRVLEGTYGMKLSEYEAERVQKRTMIAELRKELALRKAKAQTEQAQKAYDSELERIEGD